MTKFGILLDILIESFSKNVSERDYHMIVNALREYDSSRCDTETEQRELAAHGYPLTYHPCDHMERIRSAMTFGEIDNPRVQELLQILVKV